MEGQRAEKAIILLLSAALVTAYQFLTLGQATALMIGALVLFVVRFRRYARIALGGFIIGAFSDLTLNFLAHLPSSKNVRWAYMRSYFSDVGTGLAALFAGALTAWMVLDVVAISGGLNPLVGFVVGAAWGAASQYAKAFAPLLPFYKNTPYGYVENRIWDGASTAFATAVLLKLRI